MSRSLQVATRGTRCIRANRSSTTLVPRRVGLRYQTNSAQPQPQSSPANSSSHLIAGLAGGSAVLLVGYGWYHFSGAKAFVNTAHKTKATFDAAFRKSTDAAPKPSEAISWLRETVQSYTKLIPGAQSYIDSAFNDLEKIEQQHGPEVEKIVKETYDDLKNVAKQGASVEALGESWNILQKALSRIGQLAKDASQDVLNNHPELKEKVGSRIDQLKSMGDKYGPEAKKQVDEAWSQVQDIIKSGPMNPDNIDKIQKLVQEKTEALEKFGNDTWQKGLKEAQPLLDKYPQVKDFVENNKDSLMKAGGGSAVWKKLQELSQKGKDVSADDALKSVKEEVENISSKANEKSKGAMPAGLSSLLSHVPGGQDLGEKLHELQTLYEKRGKDAEELVRSALEDVKQVLSKKVEEGKKLKDQAEKDVKK